MANTAVKTAEQPAEAQDVTKTTALAVAQNTNLAPAELASMLDEDAGRGVSTNPNDVGIPFLYLLQDLSPQILKRDPKYVEGAEAGMFINSLSMETFDGDEGVYFVPCFYKSALVEWVPRKKGGGFVREYAVDDPIAKTVVYSDPEKPNLPFLPNGNNLIETRYYYGFQIKKDNTPEAAVISFSSSGLKVSRELQRLFSTVKTPGGKVAPCYSKVYKLVAAVAQKANNSWFVIKPSIERWVNTAEYNLARVFATQCENGLVRASQPDEGLAVAEGGDNRPDGKDEEVL